MSPAVIAAPIRNLLVLLAIVGLVACERAPSGKEPAAEAESTRYPLEGQLGVLLPRVYAGKTSERDRADWFGEFERSTGCRLSLKTADGGDEFIARLQHEAMDVVVADGIVGLQLIQGGAAQPLDGSRIAGLSGVDPRFGRSPWMSSYGASYAVPFQVGANVLLYNPAVFPQPITSWSLLYETQELPDGRSNAGRLRSNSGAVGIADAAIFLRSRRPQLAIADPFELDEKQFAAALELLREQRPMLQGIGHDDALPLDDFRRGDVVATSSTVRQFDRLRNEGINVAMTLPAEGSTGWMHATMLKTGARHPNCAYAFMAWSLKPRVQAQLSALAGTLPVLASVCREGRLLDHARCAELGADALDRVHFGHLPTMHCRDGSSCVPYSRWLSEFQSLIGDKP